MVYFAVLSALLLFQAIEELNAKTWAITFEKTTSDLLDVSADSTEEVLPS